MKRYRPDWRDYGELPGNYCVDMTEDPEGEYVRYEDVGWKRNCKQTPVPKDGWGYLVRFLESSPHPHVDCLLIVSWEDDTERYEDERYNEVPSENITHWMEIPEIND